MGTHERTQTGATDSTDTNGRNGNNGHKRTQTNGHKRIKATKVSRVSPDVLSVSSNVWNPLERLSSARKTMSYQLQTQNELTGLDWTWFCVRCEQHKFASCDLRDLRFVRFASCEICQLRDLREMFGRQFIVAR